MYKYVLITKVSGVEMAFLTEKDNLVDALAELWEARVNFYGSKVAENKSFSIPEFTEARIVELKSMD